MKRELAAAGFWRSAIGENHGLNSRTGDEWVTAGEATDTDRLRWLITKAEADDFDAIPEDFHQARQYIDSLMLKAL